MKKAVKAAINDAAALHFAGGALKDQDVPVGTHDLTGYRVVITFPDGATVRRDPGTEGDGFNAAGVASQDDGAPSMAAVLQFLKNAGLSGPETSALWVEAIREVHEKGIKAEELIPPEAVKAMVKVHGKRQADVAIRRRTPAKRLGLDLAKVTVERA